MTEEEARKALFQLHYNYMMHTPKEREELYEEYQACRREIKNKLAKFMFEKKQNESLKK